MRLLAPGAQRPDPFTSPLALVACGYPRPTELRHLRREDVHLEQGVILLPTAKAGARPVILSEAARKLLRTQLEGHTCEWVFPGQNGRPYSREQIGKTVYSYPHGRMFVNSAVLPCVI